MKTFTLYTLILLSFSFLLFGCNSNEPECDGNCYNGYGVERYNDGGYEKGNWRDGKLHGFGKQFFGGESKNAGDVYVGRFNNGYCGYGIYYGKKLDFIHKGYWRNAIPNGYGETTFGPNSGTPGGFYKGEWKDGRKNGYGVQYMGTTGSHAGIKYIGNWVDDKMEGTGKYYWADGSVYEGHFANDLFNGKATFIFNDGYKFVGNWDQGHNADFLKILAWHTKKSLSKDSVLNKFFSH